MHRVCGFGGFRLSFHTHSATVPHGTLPGESFLAGGENFLNILNILNILNTGSQPRREVRLRACSEHSEHGAVRHTFNYCSILQSGRSKRTCTLSKTSSFSVTRQTVFGHFFSHTVFYRNGPGAVKSVSELGKRFFGIGKKV